MIASHIPVQAQAGPAAVVTAGYWPAGQAGDFPRPGSRRRDAGGRLPGRFPVGDPIAVEHCTTIQQLGEGGVQAVCSCGWRSPVFGSDKATGTMDPLQHAAEAADLHEWEMSLR